MEMFVFKQDVNLSALDEGCVCYPPLILAHFNPFHDIFLCLKQGREGKEKVKISQD